MTFLLMLLFCLLQTLPNLRQEVVRI
jgi:hypothetical protein